MSLRRAWANRVEGTLATTLTDAGTTMRITNFSAAMEARLAAALDEGSTYVLGTLDPGLENGDIEVVALTTNPDGSGDMTVVRGQPEGGSAREHAAGTVFRTSLYASDLLAESVVDAPVVGDDVLLDEYFHADAADKPAHYSWDNQDTATAVQRNGALVLVAPHTAAVEHFVLYRSLPSAPSAFELRARLSCVYEAGNGSAALVLRESDTGKLYTVGWFSTANQITALTWANSTDSGASIAHSAGMLFDSPDMWLRLVKNAADDWDIIFSFDGLRTQFALATGYDLSAHMSSAGPDQVGISVDCRTGTETQLALHWLRQIDRT